MKKKTDIAIIGAGISGCAAAQELQASGIDYLLLEKNVEPGGLTRSISIGDAHFDYTGHYLHLSKCKSPAELPYAKQNNEEWQLIERRSVVYFEGEIIPAPLQYNLFALSGNVRRACIEGYRNRMLVKDPKSFRDYLLSGFGEAMCETFLFPYNEKQLAVSLDNLSVEAVSRFFPYPDEKRIEKGCAKLTEQSPFGYNKNFWYPKNEGIGLLAKGLAKDIINLHTCCIVEEINVNDKRIYSSQGEIKYDSLISSIPLKSLCAITNHPDLQLIAQQLRHNRVLCLNLLLDGPFHRDFQRCHWIYVPDKRIRFYRVGFYSHFDSSYVPPGKTAIYIEAAFSSEELLPDLTKIIDEVLIGLEQLDWMSHEDYSVLSANWIDCAYVHFDHHRKKAVNRIFEILRGVDVYPIGRYGLWDYNSMEDSIFSGIEVAKKLI